MTWLQNFGKWSKKQQLLRKVVGIGLGVAGVVTGGAALGGAAAAGKKLGLFKKIGNIFKKKKSGGGTVLGNVIGSGVKAAESAGIEAIGEQIGSTAHGIASDISGSESPLATDFKRGLKEGFLSKLWEENKGVVIIVGIGIVSVVGYLVFRKKRRR